MFRCDCYPNHEICKNKNTCEFWIPLNEKLDKVYRQISQELLQLEKLYQRKQDYFKIQSEIKQGMYSETINDRIVPKKNALGEDILEPEHVQVGLNYNIICQEIADTESIIRELRRIERDLLKILKKRVGE